MWCICTIGWYNNWLRIREKCCSECFSKGFWSDRHYQISVEEFVPQCCVLCWYFSHCCKRFNCCCKKELKLLYYLLILTTSLFPWVYLVLKNKLNKVQCYIKKMSSFKKIVHKSNKLHNLFDFIINLMFCVLLLILI